MHSISERLRAYGKVESLISAGGILVLGALFINWLFSGSAGLAGTLAALISLVLFIWLCLRFVPVWVAAWRGRELPAAPDASEAEQPHIRLRLFLSLLLFCIGMTLLVWLIRPRPRAAAESYYESLNYWTYTDSHPLP